ncbi:MAG TPA: protein-L-isoaspartate(D-aspartate) O-methyltransferase [Chlorobaculum sp.]|uniref:Protein-L-isoaspartate O-methyltransferase n=2 Tax=Chlorobaculum tepidum TaxID=1097 RepID=PIMT_CHLTE|nr:RecName: Full=Protein-L-isoaspartate O-methyltransferase; AltName: Full=L-isoaspartyl protein carboxyl methyltransferase; AltName: Full=Protein L-isoaspartyl methyltransferase; AltName: Full=Protein-beta-aspartate methyltransferase; Short=PIMT [Chlorobaculum tepidum TLS]AAM71450.1 protein-L-isoaspartate(D-aspartate) O-methyltransferase [Chlorobaculum tepidum TLS]HBU23678.1 protein-L-isoaspartate(D-aspartate) O-methyltransferase [Chlorobaculum sp.]
MARERQEMVVELKRYGISNARVLDAFLTVRRHLFVDAQSRPYAYSDNAMPIGFGQTISQPYTVAYMTSLLVERVPSGKVLEIGTGSGYQAAILAELGYRVYTIERIAGLYAAAGRVLDALGLPVHPRLGDGTLGWPEEAPFDGIIVTAAAPREPHTLMSQLAEGGVLVVPIGDLGSQQMTVIRRRGERFEHEIFHNFAFVPLCGREGWADNNE